MTINMITSKELIKNKDPSFIILDIREEEAYKDWHIPHAQNIPLYTDIWAEHVNIVKEKLATMPKEKKIITVCNAGITAQKASAVLESLGYKTLVLEGGMGGWNTLHYTVDIVNENIVNEKDLQVKQIIRPGKGCLSYLIGSNTTKECFIIDPSQFVEEYRALAKESEFCIIGVLDTHVHADHISGARELVALTQSQYYVSSKDFKGESSFIDLSSRCRSEIKIGQNTIKIIETPGHTGGSICLLINNKLLITGDTLFLDSVGRPDLGRDKEETEQGARRLFSSLQKIKQMDKQVLILPAHTTKPSPPLFATIEALFSKNNLFKSDNEKKFVQDIVHYLPQTPPNYVEIKKINIAGLSVPQKEGQQLEFGPNRCASQ